MNQSINQSIKRLYNKFMPMTSSKTCSVTDNKSYSSGNSKYTDLPMIFFFIDVISSFNLFSSIEST